MDNELTLEMMRYSTRRQERHVASVCKNMERVSEVYPKYEKEIVERMKTHDVSKTIEPEYTPYVYINWMYKCKGEGEQFQYPEGMGEKANEATTHHVLNNRHHPEFHAGKAYINKDNRDKSDVAVDASKMNPVDIIEMVCDWQSVSDERCTNSAREWFDKCSGVRWKFTAEQLRFIDALLAIFE